MRIESEADHAFRIIVDPAVKLVDITIQGFWTPADLARFDTVLRAMLVELSAAGCPMGNQLTLFDTTAYNVQSQDIAAGMAALAGDPTIASRKVAVVVVSALLKLQAHRAAPGYRTFDNHDAARAWLFAD